VYSFIKLYIPFGVVLVELLAPALVKGKSKTYKLNGGKCNSSVEPH